MGSIDFKKANWEKIGVYAACLGIIFMFWQSQDTSKETVSLLRERVRALEVKVEALREVPRDS